MLLDGGLESLGVCADDLANLLAVLEQQESGHGANAELLGDVWDLVDVELVEAGVGVGVGEPDERDAVSKLFSKPKPTQYSPYAMGVFKGSSTHLTT